MLQRMKARRQLNDFIDKINGMTKEPCKVVVKNEGDKGTSLELTGKPMAIVVTLAGAIHKMLEEMDLPEDLFFLLVANAEIGGEKNE